MSTKSAQRALFSEVFYSVAASFDYYFVAIWAVGVLIISARQVADINVF